MDEDWRGLDVEWLLRVSERLMEGLDALEKGVPPDGGDGVEDLFAEVRVCIDALGTRTCRPVMRSVDTRGEPPQDARASALASELVGARDGVQHLSFDELMGEFRDDPSEGMAVVGKLLLLGFHRREYEALGTTHRYYCRDPGSRAELRGQMMAWLTSEG